MFIAVPAQNGTLPVHYQPSQKQIQGLGTTSLLKDKLMKLHMELFELFRSHGPEAARTNFETLKKLSQVEHDRLTEYIPRIRQYYVDVGGFELIEGIPSFDWNPGQSIPEHLMSSPQSDQAALLLASAAYHDAVFRSVCAETVFAVNSAVNDVDAVLAQYEVREGSLPASVRPLHDYLVDAFKLNKSISDGPVAWCGFGPPKGLQRCIAKGVRWLCDLNRATIETEFPAVLSLAFHILCKVVERRGGQVVHVRNKFNQTEQPPNVHVNFLLEGLVMEVQLTLGDVLIAKAHLHHYYDVTRAKEASEILKPIFSQLHRTDVKGVKYDLSDRSFTVLDAVKLKTSSTNTKDSMQDELLIKQSLKDQLKRLDFNNSGYLDQDTLTAMLESFDFKFGGQLFWYFGVVGGEAIAYNDFIDWLFDRYC